MFVTINNTDMNVFKIDEWINHNRDANGGVISPEFAMEILSKTNFHGHIKKVLKNIKENCTTKEELMPYKEFILSCIDGRDMSDTAFKDLREMAEKCECEEEFDNADQKSKVYDKFECNITQIIYSFQMFVKLDEGVSSVFFEGTDVEIHGLDLSKLRVVRFVSGAKVDVKPNTLLPRKMDFSCCSEVRIRDCVLSTVEEMKFGDDAKVYLSLINNLPEVLDVSKCSLVEFSASDLSPIKELKLKDGVKLGLNGAKNLPQDLDVSMCSIVQANDCDFSGVKKLEFGEGSSFHAIEAKNFPEYVDVSNCLWVSLRRCVMKGMKEIKFGKCSRVCLEGSSIDASKLDFSECEYVTLQDCILSGVKEIKFKDRRLAANFMRGVKSFSGKIVYVEDEQVVRNQNTTDKEM